MQRLYLHANVVYSFIVFAFASAFRLVEMDLRFIRHELLHKLIAN